MMKFWLFLIPAFAVLPINLFASKLLQSKAQSPYTYFYKISNEDAARIYRGKSVKYTELTGNKVDSVLTEKYKQPGLPAGHYLKVWVSRNRINYEPVTIRYFYPFVFNNGNDFSVKVLDTLGNEIKTAKVKIGKKNIPYNTETRSYFLPKSRKDGVLTTEYKGLQTFDEVEKNNKYSISFSQRWRNFKRKWAQRKENISDFIEDPQYYREENFPKKWNGFVAFNQPKYRPNDTVRFKVFIQKRKSQKLLKDSIAVFLNAGKKNIKLTTLAPYSAGLFESSFVLHDSLELQLDRNYSLNFTDRQNENKEYLRYNTSFRFEDYELKANKLTIRTENDKQYFGDSLTIYFKGVNENGLNLLDARLNVSAKILPYTCFLFEKQTLIPDTLLFREELPLLPGGETKLSIPTENFPHANFKYTVNVDLLTADNEKVSESKTVEHIYKETALRQTLSGDSISFAYFIDNKEQNIEGTLIGTDISENRVKTASGILPLKLKINPYIAKYTLLAGEDRQELAMNNIFCGLTIKTLRTNREMRFVSENPQKIPFNYFIYKQDKLVAKGVSDSLNFTLNKSLKNNYFCKIQYLWAGKVQEHQFNNPYIKDNLLHIAIDQPELIFPGQKVDIEVTATRKGKPVKNADITAYSLTTKFNGNVPKNFPKKRNSYKNIRNKWDFQVDEIYQSIFQLRMDSLLKAQFFALDTVEYYRFLYPREGLYISKHFFADSLTQFAPFVVNNGELQSVYTIYVDNKPVYINLKNSPVPYSFPVPAGQHYVKIRTENSILDLGKIDFTKNAKTILSIEEFYRTPEKVKPEYSHLEKQQLANYIMPIRLNLGGKFNYIKQNDKIYLTGSSNWRNRNSTELFAPISPNPVTFVRENGTSMDFTHEKRFEYDFSDWNNVIKMRSFDVTKQMIADKTTRSLRDSVLTEARIKAMKKADSIQNLMLRRKRNDRYQIQHTDAKQTGKIMLQTSFIKNDKRTEPLNVLLLDKNNRVQEIASGNIRTFRNLPEQSYKLYFLFEEGGFAEIDSVRVKEQTTNYIKQTDLSINPPSEKSILINKMLEQFYLYYSADLQTKLNIVSQVFNPDMKILSSAEKDSLMTLDVKQWQEKGIVSGIVIDDIGEPLMSARVRINGTDIGTLTDFDGEFFLQNVPVDAGELVVTIGMDEIIVPLTYGKMTIQFPQREGMNLDEVVVVGYGTGVAKRDLVSTVSSVSEAMQGQLTGVLITTTEGSPDADINIRVRGGGSIASEKPPLYIVDGIPVNDINHIPSADMVNIEVLKDATAAAIYGSRGVNGVIIITTVKENENQNAEMTAEFMEAAMNNASIRSNFSDYAFWQPRLKTDKNGKTSFSTTYPDDITKWQTIVLAINKGKHFASKTETVRSFKPLMGRLSVPHFLIEGDSANLIGSVANYLPDTVAVRSSFSLNGNLSQTREHRILTGATDTLTLNPQSSDTLSVQYKIEREGGYFDGEERKIPVFRAGLEETKGEFIALDNDTTLHFSLPKGEYELYLASNEIDVFENEIGHLMHYEYMCNEQVASKLRAYLAHEQLCKIRNKEFAYRKDTKKLIKHLTDNKNSAQAWGWWNKSETVDWISDHVALALFEAQSVGYKVKLNFDNFVQNKILELESSNTPKHTLRLLTNLKAMNACVDYKNYVQRIDSLLKQADKKGKAVAHFSTQEHFQLIRLKQQNDLPYSLDSLNAHRRTTLFGAVYFSERKENDRFLRFVFNNDESLTLLAYQILKDDKTPATELRKIKNWFYEIRGVRGWANTYTSANIITVLFPELLAQANTMKPAQVTLGGDIQKTIKEFPFETKAEISHLSLTKTGSAPVYFTAYQRYWNENPKQKQSEFVITSRFEDNANTLTAGKTVKMQVEVEVEKDAQFVQIEIPVPAGCSYESKRQNYFRYEVHREFYKNRVMVYCRQLPQGKYDFDIELLPRYTGNYILNPAKVELMYFPTFNANMESKKVEIK